MKNKISVCFTPELFHHYSDNSSIVVIVDILRATSVISTAFEQGISSVIPVQSLNEALSYRNRKDHIIAAERDTHLVDGFEFGNSPYHYFNSDIKDKTLVLTTTNGTKAIHIAKDHQIITASFINVKAVASFLINKRKNVIILCSGWKNIFNLEDTIFAGYLSKMLTSSLSFESNCDSLRASQEIHQMQKNSNQDLFTFLINSSYRKRNNSSQLIKDTKFCLNPYLSSNIIPFYSEGKLVPVSSI